MKEDALFQVHRENKLLYTKTALYSPLDIEYQQEYRGPFEDLSFYSDDAVVIAGLKDGMISGFGRPMVAFGDDKVLKEQIQRLYNISPHITYMDYLGGGTVSAVAKFLLQKGATAKPYFTQIIDLTKTEAELHADIRKSYKSLINWGLNEENAGLSYLTIDSRKSAYRHWDRFKQLHIDIVGYQTRLDITWDIQCRQIETGRAFAILMYIEKEIVAGGFFVGNKTHCYYAVGKSLLDTDSHALVWEAILFAKGLGCKYFEIGEQVFSGMEKLVNISKFKRGFGGKIHTRLMIDGL